MPAKPTTLPQWATDGGADIVVPSAGQQGDGWDVNDRPPAAYFNWWQNLTYQWIQYLNAPVGTGPNGDGLAATGVGTGAGLRGTGDANSATAAGVSGTGGGLGGPGVSGMGGGAGDGLVGQGGGATGVGVRGTGGTNTAGVVGTGGSIIGDGVQGTGTGGGIGVKGTGQGSGAGGQFTGGTTGNGVNGIGGATSGYGVIAQADTTTPVNASFRMVPQDTDPSSPLSGDMYMHATSGMPSVRSAATVWARLLGKVYNSTSTTDTVTSATQFASTYAIPANTLRVGSVVRISAGIQITVAGGAGNINFGIRIAGSTLASTTVLVAATSGRHLLEAEFIVRAVGGSGSIASKGRGSCGADGVDGQVANKCNVITLDTTVSRTIDVSASTFSSASDTARLEFLTVEVSD